MSNNIAIKSIQNLLDCNFYIPSYQRGYRWTKQEVIDLLNDINEFEPEIKSDSNTKTWYCLQPIVVTKKTDDKWNVIDGQQRLTTIYLILHYLKNSNITKNTTELFGLEYETREGSEKYLEEELGKKAEDSSNIDYYHISVAYQAITHWFEDHKTVESFIPKFKNSTMVIWYEASGTEDAIAIFTRINSGKIALTNAELIKALFLNSSNFKYLDNDPVKLHLKQLEIASEWDSMEYALQEDSFWFFINKDKNDLPTRIEFIFNLIAVTPHTHTYSTFQFFNDKFKSKTDLELKIEKYWKEIKKLFLTLEEWYNDRELYHKIGYLIEIGVDIKAILQAKTEITSKTVFLVWIDKQISSKFETVHLDKIGYPNRHVREVLLLHNIQTMLDNSNESSRFPFDRFKKEDWDVEHIHAIATKVSIKKELQATWLTNNFVKTEQHSDEEKNALIASIKDANTPVEEVLFEELVHYVLGEEDNGLQNLCLLDRGTNRSYKNDGFKEKRRKIIEREIQGTFIPICTKNVFMMYYTENVTNIEVWNKEDKASYLNKIKEVLKQYITPTEKVANEQ